MSKLKIKQNEERVRDAGEMAQQSPRHYAESERPQKTSALGRFIQ